MPTVLLNNHSCIEFCEFEARFHWKPFGSGTKARVGLFFFLKAYFHKCKLFFEMIVIGTFARIRFFCFSPVFRMRPWCLCWYFWTETIEFEASRKIEKLQSNMTRLLVENMYDYPKEIYVRVCAYTIKKSMFICVYLLICVYVAKSFPLSITTFCIAHPKAACPSLQPAAAGLWHFINTQPCFIQVLLHMSFCWDWVYVKDALSTTCPTKHWFWHGSFAGETLPELYRRETVCGACVTFLSYLICFVFVLYRWQCTCWRKLLSNVTSGAVFVIFCWTARSRRQQTIGVLS